MTTVLAPTISDVVTEAGDDFERWLSTGAKAKGWSIDLWRSSLDELLAQGLLRWNGIELWVSCGAEVKTVYPTPAQ